MRFLPIPALLLAGCGAAPSAPSPAPAAPQSGQPTPGLTSLDNMTWKITVEPTAGGEKPYNDLMRFEDRHVSTAVLEKMRHCAPASYSAQTPPDGILTFEAAISNKEGETFSFNGKATPDAIWGTMTWRKADWSLVTYRFKGTPKTP